MFSFFIGFQIVVTIFTFIALGLLLYGDGSRSQKLMSLFMMGAVVLNVGYLFEITAQTMEAAIVATKMQYLGVTFIPIFYCWFMFIYCNEKVPYKLVAALLSADLLLLATIFACEYHNFFYEDIQWITEGTSHPYLQFTFGPGYDVFFIISYMIPYGMSLYALIHAIIARPNGIMGRKYKSFILISLFPVISLFTYVWKLYLNFDFTPAVMGIALSVIVITVWSRRNYDFGRLAADLVLKNMDDGVIMLDESKRIVNFNPAAAEIFTELSFQAVGDSIKNMEDFPETLLDEDAKGTFSLNKRYYEGHVRQLTNAKGKHQGYVVIIFDITETRNYIEEIKQVREDAERANLTKSEFLANMSHEIRTPMNAVMGLSDIIMEESRGRKVYGYACDIKAASQNLLTIINDILDLSKVESGKMELVLADYYIKGVVEEVVNMMKVAATQRGLELKCEFDTSIPCQYHGDDGRIKQILINIMNNAVKFTNEGFVKISVGGNPGSRKDMENIVFRVQDTGVGIKQENLEKIFEDFKQVDSGRNRGVEGTGLGLSITKRLVQLMKGSIEVESSYGVGSTFIVSIPQKIVDTRTLEEVPDVPRKESEHLDSFVVVNYKVLVVDDNLINRKVAIGFLKNYGFELSEAASGQEAIEMVKQTKFNMIFMDHMMPGMDGIEATKIIREECGINGRTPVIIALTANAMAGVREKFLNNGFQDFIAKPLDRRPLNEVLSRWIPNTYKKMLNTEADGAAESQPKISFEDIHIAGIDIEEAKKHHSGEVEDFVELLNLYYMDGKRKSSYLSELLEKENYKDYGIEVHGLKSASANVGAMELSAQAREHEEAATRGDVDFIKMHSAELLSCYERQVEHIKKFLDQRQAVADEAKGDEGMAIDSESLLRELRNALKKLEDFKSKECAHIIDSLLDYELAGNELQKLREIQGQLKMYEDDNAEKLLHEMIDWLEKEDSQ